MHLNRSSIISRVLNKIHSTDLTLANYFYYFHYFHCLHYAFVSDMNRGFYILNNFHHQLLKLTTDINTAEKNQIEMAKILPFEARENCADFES